MATISKQTKYIWCEVNEINRSPITQTHKDNGYVAGEKPTHSELNQLLYDISSDIKNIYSGFIPQWNSTDTYTTGSVVRDGVELFIALIDSTGKRPSFHLETAEWRPVVTNYIDCGDY